MHVHIVAALLRNVILAYIDPASVNLLLQLILGGVATLWVGMKVFGRRIMAFFKKPDSETE